MIAVTCALSSRARVPLPEAVAHSAQKLLQQKSTVSATVSRARGDRFPSRRRFDSERRPGCRAIQVVSSLGVRHVTDMASFGFAA